LARDITRNSSGFLVLDRLVMRYTFAHYNRRGEQRQHHLVHFVLVVFHCAPGLEFAARVTFRNSANYRTDTEQGRTYTGCAGPGVSGPEFAFSRNPRRINVFTPCPPAAVLPFPNGNGRDAGKSLSRCLTTSLRTYTRPSPPVSLQLPKWG
jgi:hypothetical protein